MLKRDNFHLRQEKIYTYLEDRKLEAVLLADLEGQRNKSLRYLCGHPRDALLFLFAGGSSTLLPWDVPPAEERASVDRIIPYTDYDRSIPDAVGGIIKERGMDLSSRVEISGRFFFPSVTELKQVLPEVEFICQDEGIDAFILNLRSVKDSEEISLMREAAHITNEIIDGIERLLSDKPGKITELELAFYIEAKAREMGAEGLGFETLVASPQRSFAVHTFPNYTTQTIGGRGISIVDFGVRFSGYTSDVTLSIIRKPLNQVQKKMIQAVEDVYDLALSLIAFGKKPSVIAQGVDEAFRERGFRMPHGLGHGIGLDAHEKPLLRSETQGKSEKAICDGMVFAIEPGLYHPEAGGIRLENDILFTEGKAEVLTDAHFIRLPV